MPEGRALAHDGKAIIYIVMPSITRMDELVGRWVFKWMSFWARWVYELGPLLGLWGTLDIPMYSTSVMLLVHWFLNSSEQGFK